jgi:release factor glutamine methyltransferase
MTAPKTVAPYTPVQYVMGRTEFCGLDLLVNEDVFIPRPETEVLVGAALDIFYERRTANDERRIILDLCTGSGNIAISLAVKSILREVEGLTKSIPGCKMVASDISDAALQTARVNARLNGVAADIEFLKSDLFEDIEGEFDIIVSNPPYVARSEFADLQKEVLMEPRIAIYGGEDGLDFYRRIIPHAPYFLKKGGYLIMEMGYGQRREIENIAKVENALRVAQVRRDPNGIERVVIFRHG